MPLIRPALWTDHRALQPIIDDFAALHHRIDPSFRPRWIGFTEAIFQTWLDVPDDLHLVAEHEGQIVGYVWVGCGSGSPGNYLFMRRNLFVYVVAVAKQHHRLGIGRALFAAVEVAARDFDAEIIQLSVLPGNKRARAFYANLGYVATNETLTKTLKTVHRLDDIEPA